jgi:gliding motility-associated-like protein
MMRILLLLISGFAIFASFASVHQHDHGPADLQYVQNNGQWDSNVLYEAAFPGAKMFLQQDGILWVRLEEGASDKFHDAANDPLQDVQELSFMAHAWKVNFLDPNISAKTSGAEKARHYHNYFLGDDPDTWAGNVPVFGKVLYEDLWPGIDLQWYGSGGNAKYDVLIDAGADISRIAFEYEGLEVPLRLKDGNLVITTSVAILRELEPVAWYADDKTPLNCQYVLTDGIVSFSFPDGVDSSRPIVIDPVLVGATYSGAVGSSIYGHCATYDDGGNIYSGGQAFGPGLPTSLGAFQAVFGGGFGTDIAVNKFSPDATQQIFATYIGGGGDEKPHSMIVTSGQELTVFGSSTDVGYPTSTNAYSPAFGGGSSDIVVTRLTADATGIVGSTYIGGSDNDGRQNLTINYGDTYRGEVMLDNAGNTFVTSSTQSADFPVSAGAFQGTLAGLQDGVVFGLSPDCSSLVWSTYLGGSENDNALGMRFDDNGDAIVVGATVSTDFPNNGSGWQNSFQGGQSDGYIVTIGNNGSSLLSSTYFGTSGRDAVNFIDLDGNGDIYIFGQSDGTIAIDPPSTYGQATGNIFVAKFEPTLSNTLITTKLGPPGGFGFSLAPVAFLVDVCDQIYISGYNPDSSWPTTPDALYSNGGGSSFYLAVYDVDMAGLLFGTFYGGSHVDGGTSRFDKNGIVYQGVCSGGNSMPTSPGAYAPTNNLSWDIGVFKIDMEQAGVQVYVNVNTPAVGCVPATFDFLATGTGTNITWNMGDGSPLIFNDTLVTHTYTQAGTYQVSLIGFDSLSCNIADTAFYTVVVNEPGQLDPGFLAQQTPDCNIFEITLTDTTSGAGLIATWDFGDSNLGSGSPTTHQYASPGTYNVTLFINDTICFDSAQVTIPVTLISDSLNIDIGPDVIICAGESTTLTAPFPNGTYLWNTGQTGQSISVSTPGTYWVDANVNGCVGSDTVEVGLAEPLQPLGFTKRTCPGLQVDLTIPMDSGTYQWQNGSTDQSIIVDSIGLYIFTVTDQYGCSYTDTAEVLLYDGAFDVIIPNVISPNNDGKNDEFKPITNGFNDVQVQIFNRWGMEMFASPNLSKLWDGKHESNPCPDGTYFYIVRYRNACENKYVTETGHVTVVR